jgi:LSD1 subclass zinc finger protein
VQRGFEPQLGFVDIAFQSVCSLYPRGIRVERWIRQLATQPRQQRLDMLDFGLAFLHSSFERPQCSPVQLLVFQATSRRSPLVRSPLLFGGDGSARIRCAPCRALRLPFVERP